MDLSKVAPIGLGMAAWLACTSAGAAPLTLSGEVRTRYDLYANKQLAAGDDPRQSLLRGVIGADWQVAPSVRLFGELATGHVSGNRSIAGANFQNKASLQQLYVDAQTKTGDTVLGATIGRQEFADGPRQLLSPGDGPNIHRIWNGTRLYMRRDAVRVGAYDLRATRLGRGYFDEEINGDERLRGLNASIVISAAAQPKSYLDPFWIHSENPNFRATGAVGKDERDTAGMRLWGSKGKLNFDWTLAHQSGTSLTRDVDAWALFAVNSVALSEQGWKPRLTTHVDIASGSTSASGTRKGFNPLYASSNYLGEGQFLSLSNLLMVAPGLAFAPTPRTKLSVEYGFARRLTENDAAYAGGMRAYPGTLGKPGHDIGGLLRIGGNWALTKRWSVFLNYERMVAGDVLKAARLSSGSYGYVGATWRY